MHSPVLAHHPQLGSRKHPHSSSPAHSSMSVQLLALLECWMKPEGQLFRALDSQTPPAVAEFTQYPQQLLLPDTQSVHVLPLQGGTSAVLHKSDSATGRHVPSTAHHPHCASVVHSHWEVCEPQSARASHWKTFDRCAGMEAWH